MRQTIAIAVVATSLLLSACKTTTVSEPAIPSPTVAAATLTPYPTTTPTPAYTPMPLPVLEQMPDFIIEAQPVPASRVPLDWYRADLWDETGSSGYEGSRPVDKVGYRSNVCVWLDVGPVIQSGDQIIDYYDAIERTTLDVDGVLLTPRRDERWFHVEILIYYPTVGPNTISGAPFWLCWPANLKIGTHKATVRFRQTDGTIQTYSWVFSTTQ